MPREVKSQPLAEKKASGKKPTGLGAPPRGPSSTADSYERLLLSIPEFASFGKLFKVRLLNYCHNLYFMFCSFFVFFARVLCILMMLFLPVFRTCGAY